LNGATPIVGKFDGDPGSFHQQYKAGPREKPALLIIIIAKLIDLMYTLYEEPSAKLPNLRTNPRNSLNFAAFQSERPSFAIASEVSW
jgi:hypothetical protein